MATARNTTATKTTTKEAAAAAPKVAARKSAATAKAAPDSAAAAAAPSSDLQVQFEAAAAKAKSTRRRPDNATLLKLYSYYKQGSAGDVAGERPGAFDFVGGAKYDAWAKLKGMSRAEAMQNYIRQVERLNRE